MLLGPQLVTQHIDTRPPLFYRRAERGLSGCSLLQAGRRAVRFCFHQGCHVTITSIPLCQCIKNLMHSCSNMQALWVNGRDGVERRARAGRRGRLWGWWRCRGRQRPEQTQTADQEPEAARAQSLGTATIQVRRVFLQVNRYPNPLQGGCTSKCACWHSQPRL